ncbi:DUF305 domain-containing protein [Ornithinimicrobium humiphilum]|uniref:Uncharacterized protein (DUF305 family) n=1 Tax=Ornithinimicrobium humiphilum TaxID=125288 RepID=A0A543K7L8_9MICO|nr:DUF305 domain-containing protein [Ornithinimicrobium humiphilum]TQM91088.1 uncharacterized protein (DUF305 family) [Ornithinimicrobium humiphilum]
MTVTIVGVLLAGCTGDAADAGPTGQAAPTGRILQGGAPGEANTTLTAFPEMPDLVVEEDLDFLRGMLLHHAQALEMTALVPERGASEEVALFAERMQLSQEGEIELMQDWLRERGEPVFDLGSPGGHAHGDGEPMPGILTDAQMAELRAAEGEEFDTLFLQYMYMHHEGALVMVDELFTAEAGQDSWVFNIAKEVDSDQRIEMDRMLAMLAERGAQPFTIGG